MADIKKDVRLQVFVTDSMDDKLSDLAKIMGMRKNEVVRVAIATYLAGFDQSISILRDYASKQLSNHEFKGQVELDEVIKAMAK